jgi:hypothetical protein
MIMSRQRQGDYHGRHRIKATASGGHRQDPLPPPDISYRAPPPRTDLLSSATEGDWSRWYDPSALRGIDPDIVSPVARAQSRPTQELPPWMQPKRKIQPRYITAAVATAILAVPALLMAGWVANETSNASTTVQTQLAPGTAHIPIVLVVNGKRQQVCITLANSGQHWKAWASASDC